MYAVTVISRRALYSLGQKIVGRYSAFYWWAWGHSQADKFFDEWWHERKQCSQLICIQQHNQQLGLFEQESKPIIFSQITAQLDRSLDSRTKQVSQNHITLSLARTLWALMSPGSAKNHLGKYWSSKLIVQDFFLHNSIASRPPRPHYKFRHNCVGAWY